MGHAFLPPSGAKAWVACSAWPMMNLQYPKPDTIDSIDGEGAHWVWAQMLANLPVNVGDTCPNGAIITDEMIQGAELFCDVVAQRIFANGGFGPLHVEKKVNIGRISEHNWGTPDIWAFSSTALLLEVIDYKFGHKFVDEFENWQCLDYAVGCLDEVTGGNGLFDSQIKINITIVQPRCFYRGAPVRTWTLTGGELRAYANTLRNAADKVLSGKTEAVTNSECANCPGAHVCQALQNAAYSDCEIADRSTPLELSLQAAAIELRIMERASERLEARIEGLREVVKRGIMSGSPCSLYGVEQGVGRVKWAKPDNEVIAMGDLLGVDLRKTGTITPNQAVKKGMNPAVADGLSFAPKGEMKLIKIDNTQARKVFGA